MLPERGGYAGRRGSAPWLPCLSTVHSDFFCDFGSYQSPAFRRPCLKEFPGNSTAHAFRLPTARRGWPCLVLPLVYTTAGSPW
jgi:hypothetical protein